MTAKRPTVLQIIPALDTGGAELSTLEIVDAVVRGGGRALVVSQGGRLAPKVEELGGAVILFPAATKNPARMAWNARRLAGIVRSLDVDLLHARSRAPAWSALAAARSTGRPFVTTYHGAYSEKGRAKNLYNSVMARGDMVIANSRFTADLIRSRYATPGERIRVIYRGIAEEVFDPDAIEPGRFAKLRAAWGVTAADRVILQVARVSRWKGHLDVVAAAGRLRDKADGVRCILAGDAQGREDYVEEIEARIEALGLRDRIRLTGHCDDVAAAYALAHVTVVASTEPEAFGRAAVEAQAMRCPVVSTNIGAPPETVLAEPAVAPGAATGWLVPPGDPDALARALFEALSLPASARAAMGRRAREHVLRSFSAREMQRQTLAVYDLLLGTGLAAAFSREIP